jgi:hypothetical protein
MTPRIMILLIMTRNKITLSIKTLYVTTLSIQKPCIIILNISIYCLVNLMSIHKENGLNGATAFNNMTHGIVTFRKMTKTLNAQDNTT